MPSRTRARPKASAASAGHRVAVVLLPRDGRNCRHRSGAHEHISSRVTISRGAPACIRRGARRWRRPARGRRPGRGRRPVRAVETSRPGSTLRCSNPASSTARLQHLRQRTERADPRRHGRGPGASVRRQRRRHVRSSLVRVPQVRVLHSRRPLSVRGDVRRARVPRALAPRASCCSYPSPQASWSRRTRLVACGDGRLSRLGGSTARSTGTGSWSGSRWSPSRGAAAALLASERCPPSLAPHRIARRARRSASRSRLLAVCEPRRKPGAVRRARAIARGLDGGAGACGTAEALLPWSYEPHVVHGDAAAGLGDRRGGDRRVSARDRACPGQLGRLAPPRAGRRSAESACRRTDACTRSTPCRRGCRASDVPKTASASLLAPSERDACRRRDRRRRRRRRGARDRCSEAPMLGSARGLAARSSPRPSRLRPGCSTDQRPSRCSTGRLPRATVRRVRGSTERKEEPDDDDDSTRMRKRRSTSEACSSPEPPSDLPHLSIQAYRVRVHTSLWSR